MPRYPRKFTRYSSRTMAHTRSGEIELDVGIASPAPFALPSPPAFDITEGGDLSPSVVAVAARTGSGKLRLRYTDWEAENRLLAQDVHSAVGAVESEFSPVLHSTWSDSQYSLTLSSKGPWRSPRIWGRSMSMFLPNPSRIPQDRAESGTSSWSINTG